MLVLATRGRATWLPRAAVATTGAAVLLFALSNPERRIAEHNLERYERTGKIDRDYLDEPGRRRRPAGARLEPRRRARGLQLRSSQRLQVASQRVRSYYEAFWADAPQDPEPYAFERRRALLLAEAKPGERVLDLGCGAGRFLRELGENAIGVEIAEEAARRARENTGADVRLLEPDGSIPLGHGEVDLVWCSETLEHIPDVGHALLEIRRVLKPGGRLLATVPYHPPVGDRALRPRSSTRSASTSASSPAARSRRTLDAAGFAPIQTSGATAGCSSPALAGLAAAHGASA